MSLGWVGLFWQSHVIVMLLLICLRQLGESQDSHVEELALWEVSIFMSFAYISTLHLVLTQYHCTYVLGTPHMFLERQGLSSNHWSFTLILS